MYLYELVTQNKTLDIKIKELKSILDDELRDEVAQELLDLIEIKQSKIISISIANNKSEITIGSTTTSVTAAVVIRDTIQKKIDLLTDMINSKDNKLDKLNLIRQRDKFFDEHVFIDMAIKRNDLAVSLG